MRRTMESVAAERLTKIGKNPSIVSSRADLEEDQKLVNEIVMESTPIPTSASEDEDRDSDDSSDGSKHKKKTSFKFDFSTKLHKISEERKHRNKENIRDRGSHDFGDHKSHQGHAWTKLPKVHSGSNLFGLKVPSFPERKRSGSVGDTFVLAGTRLTQSLDEADEDECYEHDGKRRGSFLGGRILKAFEMKDLKPRHQKEDKKQSTPSHEKSKSASGEQSLLAPPFSEESASLLTPCVPKDSKDAVIDVDDVTKDFDPLKAQPEEYSPTKRSSAMGERKPSPGLRTFKSSLKPSSAASCDQPAQISGVECSEIGSTQATTGSGVKIEILFKDDKADGKTKDRPKEQTPKVVFFTDPITQTYGKSKSNSS